METNRPRIPPAFVLFFLAPAIGELLSGSAPPVEFFNPFNFFVLSVLCGSGAVLVRELALRWGNRWPTILTLGLAYGIVEEGLLVKSFFDPAWMDLGLLGVYGRWGGVYWVWAVMLTLYHAVVSIAIPIMLVELIYPAERDEPWLGRRGVRSVSILLAVVVLSGFVMLTAYRPPLLPYLASVISVYAIFRVARRMPDRWGDPHPEAAWGRSRLWWVGFLGITALFFGGWDDRGRLALVSGSMSFFILLALIAEADPNRMDNPSGMALIGLVAASGLAYLGVRVRQRALKAGP